MMFAPVCRLHANQIGDTGAAAIGEALKVNAALTELQCVSCAQRGGGEAC